MRKDYRLLFWRLFELRHKPNTLLSVSRAGSSEFFLSDIAIFALSKKVVFVRRGEQNRNMIVASSAFDQDRFTLKSLAEQGNVDLLEGCLISTRISIGFPISSLALISEGEAGAA